MGPIDLDLVRRLVDGAMPETEVAARGANEPLDQPISDRNFIVVTQPQSATELRIVRLPRAPFLFQQLFFPRGGAPHLIAQGTKKLPAARLLDELPSAEFCATLKRLRFLPQEGELEILPATAKRMKARKPAR